MKGTIIKDWVLCHSIKKEKCWRKYFWKIMKCSNTHPIIDNPYETIKVDLEDMDEFMNDICKQWKRIKQQEGERMKKIIKMEITLEEGKYWVVVYFKNGYKEWHGFTSVIDFNEFVSYRSFYLVEEE